MKSSVALLLFGLVVFVATTSARPNYSESELSTFEEERELDHGMEQNRQHRRQRRRHSRQISDRFSEGNNNNVITIDEDDDDEGRPISFEPVNSNKPQARPPPPVEHGSVQAGLSPITTTTAKPKKTPGVCEAAILLCCRYSSDVQRECFQQYGCMKTYSTGLACSPKAIELVIKHFKDAYAPS
ncbi:uncharacterized protein LOC106720300 isoform X2 [Papilio machaon]|uniref:uncharacterized protein LOC106720300 isoform X2 n=1 Tax=Papilio machaon TaxID=76193 RepID=UPI001E665497|nr:uncharacterized protein LOC106720300 isoform X2 [Papilio machaon]